LLLLHGGASAAGGTGMARVPTLPTGPLRALR